MAFWPSRGARTRRPFNFGIMNWKFQDGEKIFYRLGGAVYKGVVQYTPTLPSVTEEGEECYHVRSENSEVTTCACSLYRTKEEAIKEALAEIHRLYWPTVNQYFMSIKALKDL